MSPSGHFRRIQRGVSAGCGPLCPESAEAWPGTGEHCVWPDACDSNSQTGARIMRYELADYEWAAIRPMLPNKPRGVPRVNDRRVLNGIFWVLRSGAPWRDLPEAFGPCTTCYNRFVRWRRAGVWSRIIDALAVAHDAAVQMIDTSIVRVHQHGACIHRGAAVLSSPRRRRSVRLPAGTRRRTARACSRSSDF